MFGNLKTVKENNLVAITRVIAVVAFLESIILILCPAGREGLGGLFVLPLSFAVCCLAFGQVVYYDGIGLKIYYIIALLRYMVQPLLIVLSSGRLNAIRMSVVEPHNYRVALFLQVSEIIIAGLTISRCYPKMYDKYNEYSAEAEPIGSYTNVKGISAGSWLLFFLYLFVLLRRISIWYPALNVFGLKSGVESDFGPVDVTFFTVVKVIVFIAALENLIKHKKSRTWWLYTVFLLVAVYFCAFTYFGSNRSSLMEMALTCLLLILFYLPEYKGIMLYVAVPVFAVGFIGMSISKTFGENGIGVFYGAHNMFQTISNLLEEYTNGPWCVAQSYQASLNMSVAQHYEAFCKEIADALGALTIFPGFKQFSDYTSGWKSAAEVMKFSFQSYDRGQMLSFSGGLFIDFGVLAWILMPVITYLAIKLLVFFSIKSQSESQNLIKKFIWLWSSILFSLTHCYCLQTLMYCMSKFVVFLLPFLLTNHFIIRGKMGCGNENIQLL